MSDDSKKMKLNTEEEEESGDLTLERQTGTYGEVPPHRAEWSKIFLDAETQVTPVTPETPVSKEKEGEEEEEKGEKEEGEGEKEKEEGEKEEGEKEEN